ncbi:MAG: acyltransferase [Planctomycetaceae bacterium]
MRLIYRSPLRRILGILRFCLCKVWHGKKLMSPWWGLIDSACCIYIAGPEARIQIGRRFSLGTCSTLFSSGTLVIQNEVFLNHNVRIICRERITIGDNCLFGPFVSVIDHDHHVDFVDGALQRHLVNSSRVCIGKNVWIGEKSTVLRGVTIGDNCVIGANSVVASSIPANTIAVGAPARVVRCLKFNSSTGQQTTHPRE